MSTPPLRRSRATPLIHTITSSSSLLAIVIALLLLQSVERCEATRIPLPFYDFTLTDTSFLVSYTTLYSNDSVLDSQSDVCALPEQITLESVPSSVRSTGTCGFIYSQITTNAPFEQYVIIATLLLNTTQLLPFGLDDAVPSIYLPSLFALQGGLLNPRYPNTPITLNMLMQHVSSLASIPTPSSPLFNEYNDGKRDTTLHDNGRKASYAADADVSVWESYLSNMLLTMGPAFYVSCEPGSGACYSHSFVNVAMLAAIMQRVIAAQYSRGTVKESNLLSYIAANVFAPLSMSHTSFTGITVNGAGVTTVQDQLTLLHGLFFPSGLWYRKHYPLGVAMTQPILPYNSPIHAYASQIPFAAGITRGWLVTDYDTVCSPARLGSVTELLSCTFLLQGNIPVNKASSSTSSSLEENKRGLSTLYVQVLDDNEVQFVWLCDLPSLVPDTLPPPSNNIKKEEEGKDVLQADTTSSSSSSDSLSQSSSLSSSSSTLPFVPVVRPASHCAMHVFRYNSEPAPQPTPTPAPPVHSSTPSGVYIFVGVLAVVVVTFIGSYAADYFIHPTPPAKIMLPMMDRTSFGPGTSALVPLPTLEEEEEEEQQERNRKGGHVDAERNDVDELAATYTTWDEENVNNTNSGNTQRRKAAISTSFPATFISSVVPPPQAMAGATSTTRNNINKMTTRTSIVPSVARREQARTRNDTEELHEATRPLFIVPPQPQDNIDVEAGNTAQGQLPRLDLYT